jgi:hypothetical protein
VCGITGVAQFGVWVTPVGCGVAQLGVLRSSIVARLPATRRSLFRISVGLGQTIRYATEMRNLIAIPLPSDELQHCINFMLCQQQQANIAIRISPFKEFIVNLKTAFYRGHICNVGTSA